MLLFWPAAPEVSRSFEKEWREFQSGRGIRFADREFRDMAEADMVGIEMRAIRFLRRVGHTEGLKVIATNTTDADVRGRELRIEEV